MTEQLRQYPRLFLAGAHLGGELGRQGYIWAFERMLEVLEASVGQK